MIYFSGHTFSGFPKKEHFVGCDLNTKNPNCEHINILAVDIY